MALSREQEMVLRRLNGSPGEEPGPMDYGYCEGLHQCWAFQHEWVCWDKPDVKGMCDCAKRPPFLPRVFAR